MQKQFRSDNTFHKMLIVYPDVVRVSIFNIDSLCVSVVYWSLQMTSTLFYRSQTLIHSAIHNLRSSRAQPLSPIRTKIHSKSVPNDNESHCLIVSVCFSHKMFAQLNIFRQVLSLKTHT